jgi:hypothetical protein
MLDSLVQSPTRTRIEKPSRMRLAVLLLIPLTGCLDAATGNVANIPAPTASVPRDAGMRRVFSTGLTAPTGERRTSGSRTFARGRVELKVRKDSTLEYHLNIYNPGRDNFTAAHIYRAERNGRSGPPVVTLFSGATLRDKYIQVRGTGVLIDTAGEAVLDELRANPAAFYVSLRTTREPQGALRGTIQ